MIRHLFKLVWNRKKANFLLMSEIFFSFIVLYAVVTMGFFYADNHRQPLGFEYENVWSVEIDPKNSNNAEKQALLRQINLTLTALDEVVSTGGIYLIPFTFSNHNGNVDIKGRPMLVERNRGTDELPEVLQLQVTRGRWFNRTDDASRINPLVINERLATAAFGNEDPIGKTLFEAGKGEKENRIIGVINDFRKDGEYASLNHYLFERQSLNDTTTWLSTNLLLRLQPGTTAQFEETLMKKLQATAKDWSFSIEPLSSFRKNKTTFYLTPLIVVSLIAGFLIAMVGLGLIGVIWQNVTARRGEIGLRRATGATATDIHRQILGELLILTTLGMGLGIALVIQFPLLGIISQVSTKVYLLALAASVAFVYLITFLCGLYPSWLATQVQPTEALHGD
jgi:putative ABC transport system permease protein